MLNNAALTILSRSFACQAVEREVQGHHVHARLAKNTEVATAGVLFHEFANAIFGNPARPGHTRDLQLRVGHADVRVETTAGSGHGVGGHRRVGRQIVVGTVGGDVLCDVGDEIGRSRTQIAAAGMSRIIIVRTHRRCWVACARRRWTRMKILRAGEILCQQRRRAHGTGFIHQQTAIGLVREQQLGHAENDERIQATQDDGEKNSGHN